MKYLLLYAFLFLGFISFAQEDNFVFGDVSKADLELKDCDFSPGAAAMILGKTGEITIDYDKVKGVVYNRKVHLRIKIFKKKGFNFANFKIDYFKGNINRSSDDINYIKAYTYNLNEGSIEKNKA